MTFRLIRTPLLVSGLLLTLGAASMLHAQATRTWVSGVGDDSNPGSRTAPCKTFAGAISKTAAGGEINVIDPGGFGAVTITKAITIDASPVIGGVLVNGTNGITVSAGATDVVTLRGLDLNGLGAAGSSQTPGLAGIRFISGAALHVENCVIYGFANYGIDFEPAATGSSLFVNNCTLHDNTGAGSGGIFIKPAAGGTADASLEKVRLENNTFGVRAQDGARVSVHDSISSGNTTDGFQLITTAALGELYLDNCVTCNNAANGVLANGVNAGVRLSNTSILDNNTGLAVVNSGTIVSFGNNRNAGNKPGGNGAPTLSQSQE